MNEPLVIELGDGGKAVFTKIGGGIGIVIERRGKTKSAAISDLGVDELVKWLKKVKK